MSVQTGTDGLIDFNLTATGSNSNFKFTWFLNDKQLKLDNDLVVRLDKFSHFDMHTGFLSLELQKLNFNDHIKKLKVVATNKDIYNNNQSDIYEGWLFQVNNTIVLTPGSSNITGNHGMLDYPSIYPSIHLSVYPSIQIYGWHSSIYPSIQPSKYSSIHSTHTFI